MTDRVILERTAAALREHEGARIVVAVSGGVDSVALLAILSELGMDCVAVHVNHRLRGAESDADEECARRAAVRVGCPFHVVKLPRGWDRNLAGASLQARARTLRYERIEAVAREGAARLVATGHTQDDQAETVLLNLARGSGPEGLAGIPTARPLRRNAGVPPARRAPRDADVPTSPLLLRPLLGTSRREIVEYARLRNLEWREDASNLRAEYRRNALRLEALPALEKALGTGVAERIARSAALVRRYVDADLRSVAGALAAAAARDAPGGGGTVSLEVFRALGPPWRGRLALELLERWFPDAPKDGAVAGRISRLVAQQPGRRVQVPGGSVWRERDRIAFLFDRPVPPARTARPGNRIEWGGLVISFGTARSGPGKGPDASGFRTLRLDADVAGESWVLRPWRPGDRIRPSGAGRSRKVKDLLTDAGWPSSERGAAPVLEGGGRVLCVPGVRCDASVEAGTGSARVIEIRVCRRP